MTYFEHDHPVRRSDIEQEGQAAATIASGGIGSAAIVAALLFARRKRVVGIARPTDATPLQPAAPAMESS